MKTKAKTIEPPIQKGRGKSKPVAPLPVGIEAWLSKADIAAAMRISVRRFDQLRAMDRYPKPDREIGAHPRWTIELHNKFMRGELEGYPDGQCP